MVEPHDRGSMTTSLRLLQLEANQDDADHIVSTITDGGIACQALRVDQGEAFIKALKRKRFDVILADYSLPGFDGFTALSLARQICPDIPFIFVSTTLGKDLALDAVRRGATDYILKQRLGRLVPSIHRALRELEDRLERKRVEQALRQSEKLAVPAAVSGVQVRAGWHRHASCFAKPVGGLLHGNPC